MDSTRTIAAHDEPLSIDALRLRSALEDRLFAAGPAPIRVGRFIIVDRIGRGGMGVVYRAFDPQLGRAVALKLVTKWHREHQESLLREAQALARLSHPHVVAVHEVGTHAGQLFLAMELVDGLPLDHWCLQHRSAARSRRSAWARRVEGLLEQAIRGLMAAHEVGVVHRDLKPSNILVGADGRLRLVDFGLARTDAALLDRAVSEPDLERSSGSTEDDPPALAGTPAFMAPEQFRGRADARSDEFGLCATFFEVLYGVRPYPGQTLAEIMESLERGEVVMPRDPPPVPAHLQRLLRRGLSCDPAARHGSAARMLDALEHGRRRRTRLRWAALATTTAAMLALAIHQGRAEPLQCTGAQAQLAGVWDVDQRDALAQAMRESEAPHAAATWQRIAPRLDAYAEHWVAQHVEACEAHSVRGEQSAVVMDLRMGCLRRARVELAATVQQLGRADGSTVERAHELVGGLPRLSRCEDIEVLSAAVAPPPVEVQAAVDSARVALAQAKALRDAGHYEPATAQLQGLSEQAEALAHDPLRAEVELELGRALGLSGRYEASALALERALRLGLASHQWAPARDAATVLIHVVGRQQARPEQALAYATTAWGLLGHAPDLEAEARLRANLATLAGQRGAHDEAIEQHRLARRLLVQALGPSDSRIGLLHNDLGNDFHAQGRHVESETEYRAALRIFVEALGPEHPRIAGAHTNLGNTLTKQARYAEAEVEQRAALRIWTAAFGSRHPNVAMAHNNLGNTLRAQHRLVEAEAEQRVALALYEELLGPRHPRLAGAHMNLGILLLARGQPAEAEAAFARALQGFVETMGADHPSLVGAMANLANALREQGKLVEAEARGRQALALALRTEGGHPELAVTRAGLGMSLLEQGRLDEAEVEQRAALELRLRAFGPDDLHVAGSRHDLGELLLARGDVDAAEVELRAALSIRSARLQPHHPSVAAAQASLAEALLEHGDARPAGDRLAHARTLAEAAYQSVHGIETAPELRARAAFVLGRALWSVPGARARALALVEDAREGLVKGGGVPLRLLQAIEAWSSTHGERRPRSLPATPASAPATSSGRWPRRAEPTGRTPPDR